MPGQLQNEDFKTQAELVSAGGTPSQLLNDTKIWLNASAKTLATAQTDGTIPALSSTAAASVGSTNGVGVEITAARADHTHQGIHSVAKSGSTALNGDVTLSQGTAITLTQSGQDISIATTAASVGATTPSSVASANAVGVSTQAARADHAHQGIHSFAKNGSTALFGDVTISQGTAITLTQTGQDVAIATTAASVGAVTPASVGTTNTVGVSATAARADHAHQGLFSINKTGSTALNGAVTLTPGSNITLTQSGQDISIASTVGLVNPTIQKFITGSGTYTTPANVRWIDVELVGGGGGGGNSSGAVQNPGTDGTNTTFGTSLMVGGLGVAGGSYSGDGGAGGTASLGTAVGVAVNGNPGLTIEGSVTGSSKPGGAGGASYFGGAGKGSYGANQTGGNGATNSGSGGAGGGTSVTGVSAGMGGGAGGYARGRIFPTALQTFPYSVGTGGTGGAAGVSGANGGNGAAGMIIVYEYY